MNIKRYGKHNVTTAVKSARKIIEKHLRDGNDEGAKKEAIKLELPHRTSAIYSIIKYQALNGRLDEAAKTVELLDGDLTHRDKLEKICKIVCDGNIERKHRKLTDD